MKSKKEKIAWGKYIKAVFHFSTIYMVVKRSAILASPKHEAFTWCYRSSI